MREQNQTEKKSKLEQERTLKNQDQDIQKLPISIYPRYSIATETSGNGGEDCWAGCHPKHLCDLEKVYPTLEQDGR